MLLVYLKEDDYRRSPSWLFSSLHFQDLKLVKMHVVSLPLDKMCSSRIGAIAMALKT